MTDDIRINDVINRLEKIADRFEDRCDKIDTHLEDHSKRITVLETRQSMRPVWGSISQIGSAIVAIMAFLVAIWKNH